MLPKATKVFFAIQPVDLRKSFDGLAATANSVLKKDPFLGGLFIFLNKRGDQVRILFRDPHGWCILSKRLEKARFRRPAQMSDLDCWETETKTLLTFLEHIDLTPNIAHPPGDYKKSKTHLSIVQDKLQ
jgi:transposase